MGLQIVPFEPRHAAMIEAWSSQSSVKTLLKLPEASLPNGLASQQQAWVVLIDDEPIALATINLNNEHVGYLDVIVKPSERRQGVGGQLVEYALEQPATKDLIRLHALVEQDNIAGQKILVKHGFSRIGNNREDGRLEFEKH